MTGRQRDDLIGMVKKKPVAAHQERVSALLNKVRKGHLDLARAACIHDQQAHPMSTRRNFHLFGFALRKNGVARVAEVSDRLGRRHHFEQQLKALSDYCRQQKVDAGEIPARSVETIDEADLDRVGPLQKNDRYCLGRRFGRKRTICALQHNDHRDLTVNQFGDQRRQPIVLALCPPVFDRYVLVLDVTGVSEASVESGETLPRRLGRRDMNKPNYRQRRLLRACCERPRERRATERGNELPPSDVDRHRTLHWGVTHA